jgi:hypothetical protein
MLRNIRRYAALRTQNTAGAQADASLTPLTATRHERTRGNPHSSPYSRQAYGRQPMMTILQLLRGGLHALHEVYKDCPTALVSSCRRP